MNLRKHTHTLIAIENDRLLKVAPRNLPLETAFRLADDVLRQAIQGISELITEPGLINVDFAHIRRLIQLGGGALMSIGYGQGEKKARQALDQALRHPLLETADIHNAGGIIANFTAGEDLTLAEVEETLQYLQDEAGSQAEIVMGVIQDERLYNRAQVILVVTGIGTFTLEETMASVSQPVKPTMSVAADQAPIMTLSSLERTGAPISIETRTVPKRELPGVERSGEPGEAASEVGISSTSLDIPAFIRRRKLLHES
jgi:cell division protein FtsZ